MFSIALAIAAMLASTYYKNQQINKTTNEQGRVAALERTRQGHLEDQKQQAIQAAVPKLARPEQEAQQQSLADKLDAYMTPNAPAVTTGDFHQGQNPGAPQEIQDAKQASLDAAAAKGRDYASRLADVSSYNLLNFGNAQVMNHTAEDVGNAITAQTRSSQLLPFELQAAPRVARNDAIASDVAGGIGSIAGMYALAGPTAPNAADGMGGGAGISTTASGQGLKVPAGNYDSMDLYGTPTGSPQGLRVRPNMFQVGGR